MDIDFNNDSDLICIIPARLNSKRLFQKNLQKLNDKTLLSYTIDEAIKSHVFKNVYVSTESKKVALEAEKCGAIVPFLRRKNLSLDDVTNVDVCLDFIQKISQDAKTLVCLQPSSPLKLAKDIKESLEIFRREKRDFLLSVCDIDPHDFHWAVKKNEKDFGLFFGEKSKTIRQNFEKVFRPNGAIKIANINSLKKEGNFFGNNLGIYHMPVNRSVHVAYKTDLKMAQFFLNERFSEKK